MVAGWNLLTSDAAAKRKVREIRAGVTENDDPQEVTIAFWNHVYEPLVLGVDVEDDGEVPEGTACLGINVICIPTGLFKPPEGVATTKWHPTGETYLVEVEDETMTVPSGRQVPNLITAEIAQLMAGPPKPANVNASPETNTRGVHVADPAPQAPGSNVTAAEIAMARAEAKAMREEANVDRTTPEERRIWGDAASRRTDRRIDTSWIWGPNRLA